MGVSDIRTVELTTAPIPSHSLKLNNPLQITKSNKVTGVVSTSPVTL